MLSLALPEQVIGSARLAYTVRPRIKFIIMRIASTFFALLSCATLVSAATPEDVIQSYFEKVGREGFGTIAELMHPDELKKFHDMLGPIVSEALGEAGDDAEMFKSFADPTDSKKVATLSDAQFMNTFMAWIEALRPDLRSMIKGAKIETLGHVTEGELSHVVVRMTMSTQGMSVEQLSVMSIRDFQGTPMMILSGEMKGVAESLKRQRAKN